MSGWWGSCFGSGFLGLCLFLSFKDADPVLIFLCVEFRFPSAFGFFAGFSDVVLGMAANTITGGECRRRAAVGIRKQSYCH